jgi:streptogramin lyase
MLAPNVPTNPWTWAANDVNGLPLTISIPWNASTRALQNATVTRASGCLLGHVYIGLGKDGTPNGSANAYAVPVGSSTVSAKVLSRNGLATVDQLDVLQITAGE